MKVKTEDFYKASKHVSYFLDIFNESIYLKQKGDKLYIIGENGNIYTEYKIDVIDQTKNLPLCISLSNIQLSNILKNTEDELVEIVPQTNVENQPTSVLLLSSGRSASIPTLRKEYRKKNIKDANIVKDEKIIEKLKSAAHSLGDDGKDARFASFCIEINDNDTRVTTTDGKRISIRGNTTGRQHLIPGTKIKKVLNEFNNDCKLAIADKEVCFFDQDKFVIITKVNGPFFNVENVIGNQNYNVRLNKESLKNALAFTGLFERIFLSISSDVIEIIGHGEQAGAFQTTAKVEGRGNVVPRVQICLNRRFLEDAVNSIHSKEIKMAITNKNNPLTLSGRGLNGFDVILPCVGKE